MADKKDSKFALPSDVGHDFSEERHVLTYKPKINYEEPPQTDEGRTQEDRQENNQIQEATQRLQDLIKGYSAVEHLADIAQQKIDNRVDEGGGLDIQLDPKRDAHVIGALKRCFPEAVDHSKITYEMYQHCLARMNSQINIQGVSQEEILAARNNPLQTNFGGLNQPAGSNRTEVSEVSNVAPIDLEAFQNTAVLALFALLLPLISAKITQDIGIHLATAPHSPI